MIVYVASRGDGSGSSAPTWGQGSVNPNGGDHRGDTTEDTMLAAVYQGSGAVTVEHVPIPQPADDEVLIEVSHCGICGRDIHIVLEDWGRPGSIQGHEYSGVVISLGQGRRRRPSATGPSGDRPGCGTFGCAGRVNPTSASSWSSRARRSSAARSPSTRRSAPLHLPDPDSLDLRTAALAEPVAVALRGSAAPASNPATECWSPGAGPSGY